MAINKIPESQLPTRSVSETDYVRVVGADGKSYRVPKTDFNGGGGGGTVDPSLSPTSTNAVQNKAIYSALSDLNSDIGDLTDLDTTVKTDLVSAINEVASGGGGALTQDTKQALLQCFAHTAWTDDQGQTYYDDLEDALYPFDLLSSITAVYTQSGTVYDTDSLDSLKSDLVVTGQYSDNTSNTIRNYTLSGTLTAGTSTITVTYGGKTATFTVTVSQSAAVLASISAVYTQSGTVYTTDTLDSLKTDLVVTAHYSDSTTATVLSTDYTLSGSLTVGTSTITVAYMGKTATFNVTVTQRTLLHNWDFTQSLIDTVDGSSAFTVSNATQDSSGIHLTASNSYALNTNLISANRTYEIDVASFENNLDNAHGRFFMASKSGVSASNGFIYKKSGSWQFYFGSWSGETVYTNASLAGKTLVIKIDSNRIMRAYIDDVLVATSSAVDSTYDYLYLGSNAGNAYRTCTITGLRVYDGV